MCKLTETEIQEVWTAVCSEDIDFMKENYNLWHNQNLRYEAFGKQHSLLAGAIRNGNWEMFKYLRDNDESLYGREIIDVVQKIVGDTDTLDTLGRELVTQYLM